MNLKERKKLKTVQVEQIREEIKKAFVLENIIEFLFKEFNESDDPITKHRIIYQLENRRRDYER